MRIDGATPNDPLKKKKLKIQPVGTGNPSQALRMDRMDVIGKFWALLWQRQAPLIEMSKFTNSRKDSNRYQYETWWSSSKHMMDAGWWLSLPLWKMMEFVSWDDEIPNWMEKKPCSKPPTRYDRCIVSWKYETHSPLLWRNYSMRVYCPHMAICWNSFLNLWQSMTMDKSNVFYPPVIKHGTSRTPL